MSSDAFPSSRRSLILAVPGLLLAGRALAAVPGSGRLAFSAWRDGRRIGEHRMSFVQAGEALTVATEASLSVGLGPITFYRYAHHATEHWRAGRFVGLESRTEATDNRLRVTVARSDKGLVSESSKDGRRLLGADAEPLTHWNLPAMRPPLFNPQDGKPLRLSASRREEAYAPRPGQLVRATRVSLTGEMGVDDWYDSQGLWIGLKARAKDGSIVEYRRL